MLKRVLPDVTSDIHNDTPYTLQWVGMEDIAVPFLLKQSNGVLMQVAAKANVFVSLDAAESKGIHMSRMHLAMNRLDDVTFDRATIDTLLDDLVTSQQGISQAAKVEFGFDLILKKPALLSGESGFQSYPIVVRAEKSPRGYEYEFELTIPYSSTCPCSASLTRQLYAEAIETTFPDAMINKADLLKWAQSLQGSVATPHSQRSYAYICLSMSGCEWPDLRELIVQMEDTIGTPVQTAVKRSDEQEFARLNAENLMFCEDAARRLKKHLEQMNTVKDYSFKIEHQESLHAHNAVVVDQKFGR
ncbi:GTP cyclohydrolase FolE2 [Vibrio sp. WJH972]